MAVESNKLSDAEILQLLEDVDSQYEAYLAYQSSSEDEIEAVMPVYTAANPIGLVLDADLE